MMEQENRCGGGGQRPINPSAIAPFDGGGEQLALDVGVECTAPTSGLGLDDKLPFLQMHQTLYSTNSIIHSDPLKNDSLKVEQQIMEVVDSCMPKLHSRVVSEAKCLSSEEKGQAENSVKTYQSKRCLGGRKMRKAKRAEVVVENKKDAEKQRMTHIAVERNRRRLMSDYLVVLRSLLPHDYAAKGDQASIVGGVIDYVKKLENHVKYLENEKRRKNMDEIRLYETSNAIASMSTSISTSLSSSYTLEENYAKKRQLGKKANVKIMLVQTHANLLAECDDMNQSQLIKFLAAIEDIGLTILHLNINSMHNSSFYSLSLKMEEECKIRSAEEITSSVQKVLNSLNDSNGTRSSSVTNQN